MTTHFKQTILTLFLIFSSFQVLGQDDNEGFQWLIGIETRNDFITTTGLAYSWEDQSALNAVDRKLNTIYFTYGYGLGDGSSTISTAFSRTFFVIPIKLEINYTLLDGEQDVSLEPSFGLGTPSFFEILVGYNIKLSDNIENYPSRFNLTLNINPIGLFRKEG